MAYSSSTCGRSAAGRPNPQARSRTTHPSSSPACSRARALLLPLLAQQSGGANARATARAPQASARPSISRVAAAAAAAAAATPTTTANAAAKTNTSATLVLSPDAPAPPDFPTSLPPRDSLPPLPPLDDDYERRVSFAPFANWLVPNALVLGRYPFVEPSRCLGRAQGEAQLAALIAPPLRRPGGAAWSSGSSGSSGSSSEGEDDSDSAVIPAASAVNNGNPGCGVRTFFSLQAELPPQWNMPVGGAGGGFLPYKAAAELIHAGMAGPPPQEAVDGLRNPSLDRFLPPRRRPQTAEYAAFARRESALSFLHCPIEDLSVPAMGQLKAAVAELATRMAAAEAARRKQQQEGGEQDDDSTGAVLLHCWGGRGRAGLVGACLLVAAYGLSADEALLRVQRAFDTRRDNNRRSPETEEQIELVRAFAAELGR